MVKRIWITWEIQRRNRTMSEMLGARLYEIVLNAPAWRRYPILAVRTIRLVLQQKPELIISQNPSLVLAALAIFLGKVLGISVVIDAHNAGLFPCEGKSRLLNKIAQWINNCACIVIVSNAELQSYIELSGGRAFVFPDPIPEIECYNMNKIPSEALEIAFVCSWAEDEPYLEVIRAAKKIGNEVRIYMTGDSKGRAAPAGDRLPENIQLTGFLSNESYEELLCCCDAIMVLTTRENCLVCGAYEGVAVEKPLILSNTRILKEHFNRGCVYSENTESGIVHALDYLQKNQEDLKHQMKAYKISAIEGTKQTVNNFESTLLDLKCGK